MTGTFVPIDAPLRPPAIPSRTGRGLSSAGVGPRWRCKSSTRGRYSRSSPPFRGPGRRKTSSQRIEVPTCSGHVRHRSHLGRKGRPASVHRRIRGRLPARRSAERIRRCRGNGLEADLFQRERSRSVVSSAQRKPRLSFRFDGSLWFRHAARALLRVVVPGATPDDAGDRRSRPTSRID